MNFSLRFCGATSGWICLTLCLGAAGTAWTAHVGEMREIPAQARQARQAMMEKAAAEQRQAAEQAAAGRARIARDRSELVAALKSREAQNRELQQQVTVLTAEMKHLEQDEAAVSQRLIEDNGMVRELVGVIRVTAKDLSALMDQNLQPATPAVDTTRLRSIAGQSAFPGMEDIRAMTTALMQVIASGGQVSVSRGRIIDRSGRQVEAEILLLGNFCAAYRSGGETGFLTLSSGSRQLYALNRLPSWRLRRRIAAYMDGRSASVPMDVSRGAALNQLTHALSLWELIPNGGPIVWPILGILLIGAGIVFERVLFLNRRRLNGDGLMDKIAAWAAERRWEACEEFCRRQGSRPVARVVAAGLDCRALQREEMENALQEAILKEVPPMERFLSTLGMLAAIAPLLGLLGTVTGMIDTFHVITLRGTGDPRLMSGGISEALVTTMLGLCVAIPLMVAQTLLNRSVDNHIGQMEEKALALINLVHKYR